MERYSLLKLPLPVVQRTHLSGLQPAGNTVEMEGMLGKTNSQGQSNTLYAMAYHNQHKGRVLFHKLNNLGQGLLWLSYGLNSLLKYNFMLICMKR